jgi:hypothetical protein
MTLQKLRILQLKINIMKTSLKINIIIVLIIIAYLLIIIRFEHLGGPLAVFLLMNLYSKDLIYGSIPILGIFLLIVSMFANRKIIFYSISIICLYPFLIFYSINQIKNKQFVDPTIPMLSMIPFVILTIIGGVILFKSQKEISKENF